MPGLIVTLAKGVQRDPRDATAAGILCPNPNQGPQPPEDAPQGAGAVKMPEELLEHSGVEPTLCWLSPYPYRKQKITELKIILILNSPTVKEKGKIPFIRQIPLQSSGMMSRGML